MLRVPSLTPEAPDCLKGGVIPEPGPGDKHEAITTKDMAGFEIKKIPEITRGLRYECNTYPAKTGWIPNA